MSRPGSVRAFKVILQALGFVNTSREPPRVLIDLLGSGRALNLSLGCKLKKLILFLGYTRNILFVYNCTTRIEASLQTYIIKEVLNPFMIELSNMTKIYEFFFCYSVLIFIKK